MESPHNSQKQTCVCVCVCVCVCFHIASAKTFMKMFHTIPIKWKKKNSVK